MWGQILWCVIGLIVGLVIGFFLIIIAMLKGEDHA